MEWKISGSKYESGGLSICGAISIAWSGEESEGGGYNSY
jgi:hypothetical protein